MCRQAVLGASVFPPGASARAVPPPTTGRSRDAGSVRPVPEPPNRSFGAGLSNRPKWGRWGPSHMRGCAAVADLPPGRERPRS